MATFRKTLAWVLLFSGIIGWPIAALTVAKGEPQIVLGLSFMALIYEAFNAIQIAQDSPKE